MRRIRSEIGYDGGCIRVRGVCDYASDTNVDVGEVVQEALREVERISEAVDVHLFVCRRLAKQFPACFSPKHTFCSVGTSSFNILSTSSSASLV